MYDIVIPYGPGLNEKFETSWVFDLNTNRLIRHKKSGSSFVSLLTAAQHELTLSDYTPIERPSFPKFAPEEFPAPYWDLQFETGSFERERVFVGRLLRDFGYAWRHLLLRPQRKSTLLRLSEAVVQIASLDFSIDERYLFDHSPEYDYAGVADLPRWPGRGREMIRRGRSWFVLVQDTREGLQAIQRHHSEQIRGDRDGPGENVVYVILTMRHIVLVRPCKDTFEWTQPESLYDGDHPPSDRAIDMLLWAAKGPSQSSLLYDLPVELQDRIIKEAAPSPIAVAKLGCDLGMGTPFSWRDFHHREIRLEPRKRKRLRHSPWESRIFLGEFMSGLSYQPVIRRA